MVEGDICLLKENLDVALTLLLARDQDPEGDYHSGEDVENMMDDLCKHAGTRNMAKAITDLQERIGSELGNLRHMVKTRMLETHKKEFFNSASDMMREWLGRDDDHVEELVEDFAAAVGWDRDRDGDITLDDIQGLIDEHADYPSWRQAAA